MNEGKVKALMKRYRRENGKGEGNGHDRGGRVPKHREGDEVGKEAPNIGFRIINHLIPLLDNILHLEHRALVLGPLGLPRDQILEPLLNGPRKGRTFLDFRPPVFVVNACVLVVKRGRLGKIVVERRLEFGNDARTFFGFGGVFAFFRVEPVLRFLEQHKEFGFFGRLGVGSVMALELVAGIVDVFFEGVFSVLGKGRVIRGALCAVSRSTYLGVLDELVASVHLRLPLYILEDARIKRGRKGISTLTTRFFFGASAGCAFPSASIADWSSHSPTSSAYKDSKDMLPCRFSHVFNLTQDLQGHS